MNQKTIVILSANIYANFLEKNLIFYPILCAFFAYCHNFVECTTSSPLHYTPYTAAPLPINT